MNDNKDAAVILLFVVPASEVRPLLMRTMVSSLSEASLLAEEPSLPKSRQRGIPFTVECLSIDALETLLKLKEQFAQVLVLHREDIGKSSGGAQNPELEMLLDIRDHTEGFLDAVLDPSLAEAAADGPDPGPLSPREMEVLALLMQDASNELLSESLSISLNTVKTHVKSIMRKLNTHNRAQTALVGRIVFGTSAADWDSSG